MGVKAADFVKSTEEAYSEKRGYIWATAGETWTRKKQDALENKYKSNPEKYNNYRMSAEHGDKWIGHKVDDCSGLVKDMARKHGLTGIYHGSNSQFKKNCFKTGQIVKGMKLPIGALIFTGNEAKHDHVGILVTETCITEARGTLYGVVHTPISNKKWTYWGLLEGVDYDFIPDGVDKPEPTNSKKAKKHPTLRRGDRDDAVKELQTKLANAGSSLSIDGIFGIGTQSAVKSFQRSHGLVVDGIVGPKTWAELDK